MYHLPAASDTMRRKMPDIIEKLRGGDLRSIDKANEVVQEVKNNPVLFDTVFNGLSNDEPVIRMRAADVIEKVTRDRPELLTDYTSKVISILKVADQQEVCWHMAQIVPRLEYTSFEENQHCLSQELKQAQGRKVQRTPQKTPALK